MKIISLVVLISISHIVEAQNKRKVIEFFIFEETVHREKIGLENVSITLPNNGPTKTDSLGIALLEGRVGKIYDIIITKSGYESIEDRRKVSNEDIPGENFFRYQMKKIPKESKITIKGKVFDNKNNFLEGVLVKLSLSNEYFEDTDGFGDYQFEIDSNEFEKGNDFTLSFKKDGYSQSIKAKKTGNRGVVQKRNTHR